MIHFNTTLSSTPHFQSGLVQSVATATGHVCSPPGQATHFFNVNAVTPTLKYSHRPRESAWLKIPYSWTVFIHFISYILCALLTCPETVATFYLPQKTIPSYPSCSKMRKVPYNTSSCVSIKSIHNSDQT
jgi:hypothetical protein